jgi:iron complex transport system substrate-binding protein
VRVQALRSALVLVISAAFALPCGAAISLRDDTGREVKLPQPARRIATLAPFLTELAFSAGAGESVVAVSEHSDWPPEARSRQAVSSATALSIEALVAAKPDLVLAWQDAIRPADLERLAAFGIPVFVAQARTLEDVPRLLEAVGRLSGRDVRGVAEGYRGRLATLRAAHAGTPVIPVLVEIWHRPLTTLAGRHWINEAVSLCGGRNAFDDLPGIAPVVPWELVLARDPRAIVGAGSAADEASFRAQWAERPSLAAVRAGRLVFVRGDLLQRPTLRLAEGVALLCAGLDAAR